MLCYSLVVVELKSTDAQKIWGTVNLTQLERMLEASQTLPIWTAGAVGRMISSSHLDQDNIHPSASPDQGVLKYSGLFLDSFSRYLKPITSCPNYKKLRSWKKFHVGSGFHFEPDLLW